MPCCQNYFHNLVRIAIAHEDTSGQLTKADSRRRMSQSCGLRRRGLCQLTTIELKKRENSNAPVGDITAVGAATPSNRGEHLRDCELCALLMSSMSFFGDPEEADTDTDPYDSDDHVDLGDQLRHSKDVHSAFDDLLASDSGAKRQRH